MEKTKLTRIESLAFGARLPLDAARLIVRNRALLFWSLLPLLLTTAVAIWIIGGVQTWAQGEIIHAFVRFGWNPQGAAAGILIFFSKLLLILLGAFVFSFTAAIVAAPFNDFLAEKAEALAAPPLAPVAPVSWQARLKLIRIDLVKSFAAAIGTALAMVFSWLPIVDLLVFAITFLLVAFQFLSYPQTRRQEDLLQGLDFLRRHLWACLGFGAVTTLLFAIPGISILALPVSVVAGTLLYARAAAGNGFPRLR